MELSDQGRVSLHMAILKNIMYYSGEGDFILFDDCFSIRIPERYSFIDTSIESVFDVTNFSVVLLWHLNSPKGMK